MSNPKTANDYIDSTLYAKTKINAYTAVDENGNGIGFIGTIDPQTLVGTVYSWIQHNGRLWWLIDKNTFPNHQYIFVEHKQGIFYQPTDVWQAPKMPKSLEQKIFSFAKYAAIAGAGVYIIKSILVAEISKPVAKTKRKLA